MSISTNTTSQRKNTFCQLQKSIIAREKETRTLALAKIAPKLYIDGDVCDANENECVTWNTGSIDSPFVRSARAPSKKKFVRCVSVNVSQ